MGKLDAVEVSVSRTPGGKIRLEIDGKPANIIEIQNGEQIAWKPLDTASQVVLLFPAKDKPVKKTIYIGDPGDVVTLTIHGANEKSYSYSVLLLKDVPYRRKAGEKPRTSVETPPKFSVSVAVEDPVIIIR